MFHLPIHNIQIFFQQFYAKISQHFPKLIINRKNQDTCTCLKNCKDIYYTLNLLHQFFCHLEPKLILVFSKCKYSISYYGISSIPWVTQNCCSLNSQIFFHKHMNQIKNCMYNDIELLFEFPPFVFNNNLIITRTITLLVLNR